MTELQAKEYINLRTALVKERGQVVHMWRNLGIPTFQVNYGLF